MRMPFFLVGFLFLCGVLSPAAESIQDAIGDGNLESVKSILKADPEALYKINEPNRTIALMPLTLAALLDKTEILQFLIDSGADVNKVADHRFATPMLAA